MFFYMCFDFSFFWENFRELSILMGYAFLGLSGGFNA